MGASWEPLGGLLEPLEGLLGPLGAVLNVIEKSIDFKTPLGSKKGGGIPVLGHPFWHQNRPKTAPETSQNPRRFSRAIKVLFKSVLEPSWADLGSFWAPSWGQKNHFRIGKRSTGAKSTFLTKIGFRNASWSELGPSWAPRWPKMTPQEGAKTAPNRPKIGAKKRSKI